MGMLGDSLDKAVQGAFTRVIPKSAPAQMRYLVKQLKGTRATAELLGVSQRTVERYVKDQIKRPRADLAARIEREVRQRWQPQIRARAKQAAATRRSRCGTGVVEVDELAGNVEEVVGADGTEVGPQVNDAIRSRCPTWGGPPTTAAGALSCDRRLRRPSPGRVGRPDAVGGYSVGGVWWLPRCRFG